jgi:hypothetical protein
MRTAASSRGVSRSDNFLGSSSSSGYFALTARDCDLPRVAGCRACSPRRQPPRRLAPDPSGFCFHPAGASPQLVLKIAYSPNMPRHRCPRPMAMHGYWGTISPRQEPYSMSNDSACQRVCPGPSSSNGIPMTTAGSVKPFTRGDCGIQTGGHAARAALPGSAGGAGQAGQRHTGAHLKMWRWIFVKVCRHSVGVFSIELSAESEASFTFR